MFESLLPVLQGLINATKAMASFDAFRKAQRGEARALIEELKENSRLCFRVIGDGVDHRSVVPKFSTAVFDRLNAAGFNFNVLQRRRITAYPGLAESDLARWSNKTTAELVTNIYDKLKDLRSRHEFMPDHKFNRRRLINIHKRLLLLLRHARDEG